MNIGGATSNGDIFENQMGFEGQCMKPRERNQLIDALMEGEIDAADFRKLEAELTLDHDARSEYYRRLALNVSLEAEAGANSIDASSSHPEFNKYRGLVPHRALLLDGKRRPGSNPTAKSP